jgi:glutamate---cysteine ligase / carboxylate-amine ligase
MCPDRQRASLPNKQLGVETVPQSSASEHRFGSTPPYTLGVEEEYMLLDPANLDLVDRVEAFLKGAAGGECAGSISCELFQSELEVQTPVCASVPEVERELRRLREHVGRQASGFGVSVASAGTHPFALFEQQHVTPRPRYHDLLEQIQYPARRELIFGLHVHVGMPTPDAAMRVLAGLRPHLPELVALSASSPFWRGNATGLASTRQAVFSTFPRSGIPPRFDDYAQFEHVTSEFERAGYVEDYTRLWWDLRPHPQLGTLEVRVMDAVPRVEDALAIAAYIQALAKYLLEESCGAEPHDALIHESKWQAVRHGLDARVFAPEGLCSMREAVLHTLARILPHAEELGAGEYLEGIERIVDEGNSAERQLDVFEAERDVAAVAAAIVEESVVTQPVFA